MPGAVADGQRLELGSRELSAQDILSAQDLRQERVEVPEWGGHVYVASMTARERDEWEQSVFQRRGRDVVQNTKSFRASLAAATMRSAERKRLFTEHQVEQLAEKSAGALERIVNVAQRLNRLRDEDVEELVGNSARTHGAGGSSSSPGTSA